MRQIKRIAAIILAGALLLAGCGGKNNAVDINAAQAAQSILEAVDFQEALVEAQGEVASGFYLLDDKVDSYAIYICGSGATAEEIAVLKVSDEKDASHAKEIVEERLDTLKLMFENYRPDEMVKINNAVIETRGNVVYFITANDVEQAKKAIDTLYS